MKPSTVKKVTVTLNLSFDLTDYYQTALADGFDLQTVEQIEDWALEEFDGHDFNESAFQMLKVNIETGD